MKPVSIGIVFMMGLATLTLLLSKSAARSAAPFAPYSAPYSAAASQGGLGPLPGLESSAPEPSSGSFRDAPGELGGLIRALGPRVAAPGKERTVLSGEFIDAHGSQRSVLAALQLDGSVQLDGFKPDGSSLRFDAKAEPPGNLPNRTPEEAALLEAFSADTAEGMLAALDGGAALRLLGRRARLTPETAENSDRRVDVYEVTGPVKTRGDDTVRSKLYYFDSDSGLLQWATYRDHSSYPPMKVETRFGAWRAIDGSAYPGRIERFENGERVFQFVIAAASSGPVPDPSGLH